MDDGLKQRLVGALVLTALAVIFLPTLFHREQQENVDQTSQIPVKPRFEPVVIEPPPTPVIEPIVTQEERFQPAVKPEPQPQVQTAPEVPTLDSENIPKAWVLQVASFKEESRAVAHAKELMDKGYRAFVRSTKVGDGTVNRVFIGPNIDKNSAQTLKLEVDKKLGINSLLIQFSP